MSSPAERFAAARSRRAAQSTELAVFRQVLGFELDPFQVQACEALEAGRGVLVAAPTGAGKTVVGEFAVHLALAGGRKAFYTTPIKALSNQKYVDLVARHGERDVGLLTGDISRNGEAPVVVMTTEVLRNMIYAGSATLHGLGYVVMDEVHYLADRFRGAVWEEVIIHLPDDVLIASLSATVSNAEEFGAWLDTVRGDTEVVVSEHRPVPLWQHVMVGTRLLDLFTDAAGGPVETTEGTEPDRDVGPAVNVELLRIARGDVRQFRGSGRGAPRAGHPGTGGALGRGRAGQQRDGRARRGRGGPERAWAGGGPGHGSNPRRGPGGAGAPERGSATATRAQVVERLDAEGLLPAITFVFSRAGCDAAVRQCLAWGVRLTTPAERNTIRSVVEERTARLADADLAVLGYWEFVEGLERGVAAHHAGMLPAFKEVVEHLFTRGLVKAVFATETLALGINMPARSVVLEKLVKFNGETHAAITPGEYTQLTGRAGRRGIDVEGHAVVLWTPGLDPEAVGGLASTRTYPLRSSFAPTYNMAVNLVAQVGRRAAREILETSFAQFQADRAVVGLARKSRRQEEALTGYAEAMTCHLGDFAEYAELRRRVGEVEKDVSRGAARHRRAQALASLENLSRGDVIRIPAGRRSGFAVVLDPGTAGGLEGPRPVVLTSERQVRKLSLHDVQSAVEPMGTVKIPAGFNPRHPGSRRDLAWSLRGALTEGRRASPAADRERVDGDRSPSDTEVAALRRSIRTHPCHRCSEREEHARWAERWLRLRREHAALVRSIEGRTSTIARTFDRVCDLLTELGYLPEGLDDGAEATTAAGERLRRVYAEKDLLVAQCLRAGVWAGLDGPGLAAVASTIVYEARREERGAGPKVPGGAVREAIRRTVRLWSELEDAETRHRLDPTGEPDLGLAWPVHRWAQGQQLDDVLSDGDLAAGDFVRWCKQVVDLLDQVAGAALDDRALRAAALDAIDRVRRGVVADSALG